MNRQQRRARTAYSRAQWCLQMAELRKNMPTDKLDDVSMAQLLTEIIVNEQLNVSEDSLGMLVGLACACMDRAMQAMPPASHVDKDGRPMYSAEQVGALTGQTKDQVLAGLAELARQTGQTLATDADVHPLH